MAAACAKSGFAHPETQNLIGAHKLKIYRQTEILALRGPPAELASEKNCGKRNSKNCFYACHPHN